MTRKEKLIVLIIKLRLYQQKNIAEFSNELVDEVDHYNEIGDKLLRNLKKIKNFSKFNINKWQKLNSILNKYTLLQICSREE